MQIGCCSVTALVNAICAAELESLKKRLVTA